jgi:hypothetical protein
LGRRMVSGEFIGQFDKADEVREFPFGRFEIVHVAGVTLGRATYQPGWKWSVHNAPIAGTALCHAPHTGVAIAGHGIVQYQDGRKIDLLPGTVFHITTTPHDSWVHGDAPYVSLHVLKSQ